MIGERRNEGKNGGKDGSMVGGRIEVDKEELREEEVGEMRGMRVGEGIEEMEEGLKVVGGVEDVVKGMKWLEKWVFGGKEVVRVEEGSVLVDG